MGNSPEPMNRLVAELARLPGIGGKTAARLAHHILKSSAGEARALAEKYPLESSMTRATQLILGVAERIAAERGGAPAPPLPAAAGAAR